MKITILPILDVTKDNLNQVKIKTFDKIIDRIEPELNNEFKRLQDEEFEIKKIQNEKQKEVNIEKAIFKKLTEEFRKKKKEKELSLLIKNIFNNEKLMRNKEIKSHVKLVLKVLDKLDEKKLEIYINEFTKTLNKSK